MAKIIRTDAIAELEPGTHRIKLGFAVAEGTADDPREVTVRIECKLDEPCAYLHATHTEAAIQEEVKINLALYNPLERNIVAQMRLVVRRDGTLRAMPSQSVAAAYATRVTKSLPESRTSLSCCDPK